jgi:hypothetical protein
MESQMGFDVAVVQLLCCAKSIGVDFAETITIGRQTINDDPVGFASALTAVGISKDVQNIKKGEFAEPLLNLLGAKEVCSLDASNYEQATYVCDLNEPCPPHLNQKFSLVIDGGTLEHVFNLPQALKNCMAMVRVGGHFVQVTAANNFMGHGFWQLSPEAIYRVFSKDNGFSVRAVFLREDFAAGAWYQVADPATYGGRVQLVNFRPTYICTIANRLADDKVFAVWPQQSDYVEKWKQTEATPNSATSPKSFFQSIRNMAPRPLKKLVRAGLSGKRPSPFDRPYYHHILESDLVRGRLRPNGVPISA